MIGYGALQPKRMCVARLTGTLNSQVVTNLATTTAPWVPILQVMVERF